MPKSWEICGSDLSFNNCGADDWPSSNFNMLIYNNGLTLCGGKYDADACQYSILIDSAKPKEV